MSHVLRLERKTYDNRFLRFEEYWARRKTKQDHFYVNAPVFNTYNCLKT